MDYGPPYVFILSRAVSSEHFMHSILHTYHLPKGLQIPITYFVLQKKKKRDEKKRWKKVLEIFSPHSIAYSIFQSSFSINNFSFTFAHYFWHLISSYTFCNELECSRAFAICTLAKEKQILKRRSRKDELWEFWMEWKMFHRQQIKTKHWTIDINILLLSITLTISLLTTIIIVITYYHYYLYCFQWNGIFFFCCLFLSVKHIKYIPFVFYLIAFFSILFSLLVFNGSDSVPWLQSTTARARITNLLLMALFIL